MIKRIFYLIVPAIFLGMVLGCSNSGTQREVPENGSLLNKHFLGSIKTVPIVEANRETEMTLTGKVINDPDRTVSYASLVSGVVDRTYFSLGDKVRKGQVLMDIRSTELSEMESELVLQESGLAIANRELQSAQALYQSGMLSQRELLEAEVEVKQQEAALAKIRADISMFGTSKGKGTFSVTAPVDGYIISKDVSAGSTLHAEGEPAFIIADLSTVWIVANVYASNLGFVREGMKAFISALPYPNEQFEGKINSLSQVFDPEDKALKARIVMDNPELKLKPEMSVVIRLKEEYADRQLMVPSDAVIFDNDTYFVVVQEDENEFAMREVAVLGRHSGHTFLTGAVTTGEKVVVKNQLLIYSELKGK